jgi:hypothetical protein
VANLQGQDFVFVHSHGGGESASIEHIVGAPLRRFLTDRIWDLTSTGATIYGRRVIDWWRSQPAPRVFRNFPQLSVILAFAAAHGDTTARWTGRQAVHSHPRRPPSYWLAQALQVWGQDWREVVSAHGGAFLPGALPRVLKSHSRHTGLLGAKHLLVMRAAGLLTPAVWQVHADDLRACSAASPALQRVLMALPHRVAAKIVSQRPSWGRRFLPPPTASAH